MTGDSMERLEILILTVALSLLGVDLFFLYKACCFGVEGEKYLMASKTLLGINLLIAFMWVMISDL